MYSFRALFIACFANCSISGNCKSFMFFTMASIRSGYHPQA